MQVSVGAGTYVVAVSGGVDSVVLLDLLIKQYGHSAESPVLRVQSLGHGTNKIAHGSQLTAHSSNRRFVVAHFDHGIREDSATDRKVVQDIARRHDLPFVHANGHMGPGTSEAKARAKRYEFLGKVMKASGACGIITAHHQDDLLETAILNLLRGSGRRGLTSLKSSERLVRPLLGYTKDQLREYATIHHLGWRDDPTNIDTRFTRNYVRHNILPKFSVGNKAQLLILLEDLQKINHELDVHIINLLHVQPGTKTINRQWFIHLPHDIACEVVHAWLYKHDVHNLERNTIERLIVAMKTGRAGRHIDVDYKYVLEVHKEYLALVPRDR